MLTAASILAFLAALGSGVMCGFFYGFSCVVMPAFARRPDGEAAEAMREINRVVLNTLFFLLFFGTAALAVALAIVAAVALPAADAALAALSAAIYVVGCVGFTMARNVPLNQELERADAAAAARLWPRYLADWTWWNHVRTIACGLAAAGFLLVRA